MLYFPDCGFIRQGKYKVLYFYNSLNFRTINLNMGNLIFGVEIVLEAKGKLLLRVYIFTRLMYELYKTVTRIFITLSSMSSKTKILL